MLLIFLLRRQFEPHCYGLTRRSHALTDPNLCTAIVTFVENADCTCQLTLFPGSALPSNVDFRCIIYDVPSLSPIIQYIMHIQEAVNGNFPPAEVYCETDAALSLNCETTAGAALQNPRSACHTSYCAERCEWVPAGIVIIGGDVRREKGRLRLHNWRHDPCLSIE